LEIWTPDKNLLREVSATEQERDDELGKLSFKFRPICNSRHREFLLRFISVPETQPDQETPYWFPSTGFIHMLYAPQQKMLTSSEKAEKLEKVEKVEKVALAQ
jgi:hypothetical protein